MKQVEYYKNGNRTLRIKYEGIKKLLEKQDKEIDRLHSIIKEVREYIENDMKKYGGDIYITCKDILEILDKENSNGNSK